MTLRDKAAGLLVVRLGSNMVPPRRAEQYEAEVASLLDAHPALGGLIVFNGSWRDTPPLLARLQAKSTRGLLVMTDMERGLGQQFEGATVFPHLMAFGALDADAPAAVRAFARAGAREALAAGVHVALAPVADVNREPRNPIIATRAFGTDPEGVARLVEAYTEGAHAEGLLVTAKHFPGHGGTSGDSHAELPVVADARAVLDQTDLVPFRAAIAAGTDLVMTAHVAVPALDASGQPATRSRPILHDLLRKEMGFRGAVVTDSLHMGGIQDAARTEASVAVDLVLAGVDLLLDAKNPDAIIEGLVQAVSEGRLTEARLDEANARADVLRERLRARFEGDVFRRPPRPFPAGPNDAPDALPAPPEAHRALAERAALDAVVVFDGDFTADYGDGTGLLVVLVRPAVGTLDPPQEPLGAAVRNAFPRAEYREIAGPADDDDFDAVRVLAGEEGRRLVVAIVVKPAAWHAFGLPERTHRFVSSLVAAHPTVLAALGSPRALDGLDGATARLGLFSDVPASQRALVRVLAGQRVPRVLSE